VVIHIKPPKSPHNVTSKGNYLQNKKKSWETRGLLSFKYFIANNAAKLKIEFTRQRQRWSTFHKNKQTNRSCILNHQRALVMFIPYNARGTKFVKKNFIKISPLIDSLFNVWRYISVPELCNVKWQENTLNYELEGM
jgi:hypothetical protein